MESRIYLSPPHLGQAERDFVEDALNSNWIAPLGPHVDAFEREFAERVGAAAAVAVSSGTAALHLALRLAGVSQDHEVMVSTLTFAGGVFPIVYEGARPVFIDSEAVSWNMDPGLLGDAVESRVRNGRPPAAVVVVDLYGQTADLDAIMEVCRPHGIPVVEDAAEALGATYRDRAAGTIGDSGIFSFNGNKIITTSGGGMLVVDDRNQADRIRKLASQAREPTIHYEHAEVGYNYRMSNILAAIGRGQLQVLSDRIRARRRNFELYYSALEQFPGIDFMPEAPWGYHTRWLTCITVDADRFGASKEEIRVALGSENIEARPLWKPMHLQPVFTGCEVLNNAVAERLFEEGLCLPSGSSLRRSDIERIVDIIVATGERNR